MRNRDIFVIDRNIHFTIIKSLIFNFLVEAIVVQRISRSKINSSISRFFAMASN